LARGDKFARAVATDAAGIAGPAARARGRAHGTCLQRERRMDFRRLANDLRRGPATALRCDDGAARTTALEDAMAARLEAAHAVAVASPMVAFHLAYRALGVRLGATLLTTSLADPSVVRAAIASDCRPRFGDVDERGHLAPAAVRAHVALRGMPAVVVASHHAGQPCDTAAVAAAAPGALLIEDAVDALGAAAADGRPVGGSSHAVLTVVGIQPVRASAPAQGAVLTTDDAALAGRCRRLRDERVEHRLSELHATLALVQLGRLRGLVAERARFAARWDALFAEHAFASPVRPAAGSRSAWWSYLVRVPAWRRGELADRLRALGADVRPPGMLLHRHPFFGRYADVLPAELPATERFAAETLVLPTAPARGEAAARAGALHAPVDAEELRRVAVAG
jgi:dTDP-4-amino-4,6-dideoxygalactose transaminase